MLIVWCLPWISESYWAFFFFNYYFSTWWKLQLLHLGYMRRKKWLTRLNKTVSIIMWASCFQNFNTSDDADVCVCTHKLVLLLNSAWILSSFCLQTFTSSDLGSSYSFRRAVIPKMAKDRPSHYFYIRGFYGLTWKQFQESHEKNPYASLHRTSWKVSPCHLLAPCIQSDT